METEHQSSKASRGIAWPIAHLLALAPLDVWIRMLARSGGVHPRYWVRVAFILFTSFVGTICTVHERLVLHVIRRIKFGRNPKISHAPGTVVILGYYRSGTTHLHNLMSCDQRFVTPRWSQCLAGQGFVVGWSILRFVLVPFLGSTRPQDAVGFGPSWPAEDDFAMSSWGGCSSIPGRFVWPSRWGEWKRWHGLEGLSEKELSRWRSLMAMFVWKLTRGKRNRTRVVLLKTPSHTARVAELDRLFGGDVKFVHLVREPTAVIDSNVRLHDSLSGHLLEDSPDVQSVRDRIVGEYAYTETKCRDESQAIDADRFVRVRYQDLRADGVGTTRRIYEQLGLGWDEPTERSINRYLGSLGAYSSEKKAIELGNASEAEQLIVEDMIAQNELHESSIEHVSVETVVDKPIMPWRGFGWAVVIALMSGAAWIGLVWLIHTLWVDAHPRLIPLTWICGSLIGLGAQRAAGGGSRTVGFFAAVLSIVVVIAVAFPVTVINWNWAADDGTQAWLYHNAKGGLEGLKSVSSLVFISLGAMTAFRHGSANGAKAPGLID